MSIEVEVADVDGAYLTAPPRGAECWARVPKEIRPSEREDNYKNPVVKLSKALYGLPREGFDWYHFFGEQIKQKGWTLIPGYDSLYMKEECIFGLYVNVLIVTERTESLKKNWAEITGLTKLKEPPVKLDKFLGICYSITQKSQYKYILTIDQTESMQN